MVTSESMSQANLDAPPGPTLIPMRSPVNGSFECTIFPFHLNKSSDTRADPGGKGGL